jgi:hypothetical protein
VPTSTKVAIRILTGPKPAIVRKSAIGLTQLPSFACRRRCGLPWRGPIGVKASSAVSEIMGLDQRLRDAVVGPHSQNRPISASKVVADRLPAEPVVMASVAATA